MEQHECIANKYWNGPGQYLLSDGLHVRHLGYCIYQVDLVKAVRDAYDAGFDLSDIIIGRIKVAKGR
jgi:hypothetical protein